MQVQSILPYQGWLVIFWQFLLRARHDECVDVYKKLLHYSYQQPMIDFCLDGIGNQVDGATIGRDRNHI
ncbi:hypothetical protein ACSBR2_041348 [Camellia fascicularis]